MSRRLEQEKSIIDEHFKDVSPNHYSTWDGENYRLTLVLSDIKTHTFRYSRTEMEASVPLLSRIDTIDYLLK